MYTILINDDNTLTKSTPERIMHRSHNVNTIRFLLNPTYFSAVTQQEMDMTGFMIVLEYKIPYIGTYKPIVLTAQPELYKERLSFLFPVTSEFTAIPGDVSIKFTMTKVDLLEDGTKVVYSRPTTSTNIHITAVENWSDQISVADLGNLAEIMLELQAKIEQNAAYAEQINVNKADTLKLDTETSELALYSGDQKLSSVDLDDLGDSIADATDEGLVKIITI